MVKLLALTASLAVLATAFVQPQAECQKAGNCKLDCAPDSKDGLQAECWDFLNMTGYIREWVQVNGKAAGVADKGFAQAFLAWNGMTGKTCNLITADTCDAPDTSASKKYASYQQFYTLWNIYAVWQFFNQYSTALTASSGLASNKLAAIVEHVDPSVEHQLSTPAWYTATLTGLFAAGFAGTIITAGASTLVATSVATIVNGLWLARSVPPLGQPSQGYTETANTRFHDLADVGSALADIISGFQDNLAGEIQQMQDNVEPFIALCGGGGFSERVTLSIPKESTILYRGLELFVLGEAMKASGVVIAKSTGVDPRTIATQSGGAISCPGFGPAGNCYNWWYGGGNTYAFHDTHNDQRDFTDLINFIWDQQIVTDMAQVFQNEACQGQDPTLGKDKPNTSCMMTATQCEYAYDTHYDVQSKKEFKNCPNDPHWMASCGKRDEAISILPQSYLGPLLRPDGYCRTV